MLFSKAKIKGTKPCVFIHGFLGSHKDAQYLLESSQLSWHLIDLPGHGKSSGDLGIDDLNQYLKSLNDDFHLVGYSLGGRIAQKLAHHPRCLSLTILSSDTIFDENKFLERVEFETSLLKDLETLEFPTFLNLWYQNPLFSSFKRKKRIFDQTLILRENQNVEELIKGIKNLSIEKIKSDLPKCPILALYGMLDQKYKKRYTLLPEQVHVVSIPHAGHVVHLENPKCALKVIEKFIGMIEHDVAKVR